MGTAEEISKVPKDAKEDWNDLVETLKIHEVALAATASPAQVVEEAIERLVSRLSQSHL